MITEGYAALFVLVLMLGDIASGYIAAISTGTVSSKVMRTGLFKKFGSILVVALSFGIGHGGVYIGLAPEMCTGIVMAVCGVIGVMEVTSILENACILNPDLPIAKLFSMFGVEVDE